MTAGIIFQIFFMVLSTFQWLQHSKTSLIVLTHLFTRHCKRHPSRLFMVVIHLVCFHMYPGPLEQKRLRMHCWIVITFWVIFGFGYKQHNNKWRNIMIRVIMMSNFPQGHLYGFVYIPTGECSIRLSVHNKLSHRFYGPVSILRQIGQVAYELD